LYKVGGQYFMTNILVTGATGLIGSSLLKPLANIFEVHATSRSKANDKIANVTWHHVNLNDDFDFKVLPTNIDAVIYLAQSENYRDFPKKAVDIFEINTVKLLKMLDYAREAGVKKFIYASSGGVYGSGEYGFSEEITVPANGANGFYLSSKLCSEVLADNYKQFMDVVILRLFFVYGKIQKPTMLMPRLVTNVKNGNPINLQGNNGILLNPVHVSDAVSSVIAALELKGFHKINVAGPEVISLKKICEMIGDKIGVEPIFEYDLKSKPKNLIGDIDNMTRLLSAPRCFLYKGLNEMINKKEIQVRSTKV